MKKLTIHGNTENVGALSPKVREIMDVLDNAKEHEAFTGEELCIRVGVNVFFVRQRGRALKSYRFKTRGSGYLYANLKTVQNHKEGMYE